MSTNINITVGDNALLDRAKQQQAANRQAQLNRENSTRLEAQATDERTKAQAASGKDANGNPLYGVPTTTPSIDRRPAANRQGGDVFANFFVEEFVDVNSIANVRITSGDGLSVVTVPWPTLEDFPDLLLPYPKGELRGAVISGTERALRYDSLGRLLGSASTSPAEIYYPSKASFFSFQDGLVTFYEVQAFYFSTSYVATHILPTGKGNALVIVRTARFKRATTRIIRVDRDKYYSQVDFNQGIYECYYDTSPIGYKDVKFHVNSIEQFHVFAVSTNKVRYIGLAPEAYTSRFRTLPGYKGFNVSDLTVTNSNVATYDYYRRTIYSNCAPGDEPVDVSIPWSASYSASDFPSNLRFNSLVTYKLIPQPNSFGSTITPSAYTVFTNSNFYPSTVSSQVTNDLVISYLPAKAASLKWRTPNLDETPYSYLGIPPVSWGTYSTGPLSIRTNFPDQWKKSGKTPKTTPDRGTPISVWDWNDPAYCREQALALGFTSADLTP